jgi:hypothetical protein
MANGLPAGVAGPPVPAPGEERIFSRRVRGDALAWALAGGIAICGEIGRRHECDLRLRVVGQLPVLFAWARRQGLPPRSVHGGGRDLLPHIDVGGRLAGDLADRARLVGERGR